MHLFKYLIYTFFILSSFIFGDKGNGNSKQKLGIGLEFEFLTALLSGDGFQHIYIPMNYDKFFIEPEIIYYTNTESTEYDGNNGNNHKEITKGKGIALGLYRTKSKFKSKGYYGAKLGYLIESEMPYASLNQYELVDKTTLLFAPTVGSEYYISENFSFGGEIAYQIMKKEREFDEESSYSGNAFKEITKSQNFRPKLMVRFYF